MRLRHRFPAVVAIAVCLFPGSWRGEAQSSGTGGRDRAILPANTQIFLSLKKPLSKNDAKPGTPVELQIVSDVVVNGQVLIRGGTVVSGNVRGIDPNGKGASKVLLDLGPLRTTTGDTAQLTTANTKGNSSDIPGAISFGSEAGVLAPIAIPVIVVADAVHSKNVLWDAGSCVVAQVVEDVALDPEKVLGLPREQYGSTARDRAFPQPCGSLPFHAISEYRTKVEHDPGNRDARIGLIEALIDTGNIDAALTEVQGALAVWPNDVYLRYLKGEVLVDKKEPDAAIVELQWVLQKANNRLSPANCALGRAFELKNDTRSALKQYRIAYRAHISDSQCRASYERLRQQFEK